MQRIGSRTLPRQRGTKKRSPARAAESRFGRPPARSGSLRHQRAHPSARHGRLSRREASRKEVAGKMAHYSGLSEESILQLNLDVPTSFFLERAPPRRGLHRRPVGLPLPRPRPHPGRHASRLQLGADVVAPLVHAGDQLLPARASRVRDGHQVQHVRPGATVGSGATTTLVRIFAKRWRRTRTFE